MPLSNAQRQKRYRDRKKALLFSPEKNQDYLSIATLSNKTLLKPTEKNPQFTQLFHIYNDSKDKAEAPICPIQEENDPTEINYKSYKNIAMCKKAESFINSLGSAVWNRKGEIVIKGEAIPHSQALELLNFAVSNWKTMYTKKPPIDSNELMHLIQDNQSPQHLFGKGIQQDNNPAFSSAEYSTQWTRQQKKRKKLLKRGLALLCNSKQFKNFINV